jgi:hypothetical protein
MVRSEDVLKDDQSFVQTQSGTLARKGTVAATMLNARALDHLLSQPLSVEGEKELKHILEDVQLLLPMLHAIQLFEFFSPIEWLQTSPKLQEGRILIAILYLQQHPELVDQQIITHLHKLKGSVSKATEREIQKLVTK